jgi:hypothetical protein
MTAGLEEPDIDDLLEDPTLKALLKRDGITPPQLRSLVADVRLALKKAELEDCAA